MRVVALCSLICLSFSMSGCVSLTKYQERENEVADLKGRVVTLEENLKQSEKAGKAVGTELRQCKENLAKLQQQHEELKTKSLATPGADKAFATDLERLTAKLAESEARIRELTASLAAQQEATKPALAERDERIKVLGASLQSQNAEVTRLKKEVAELSRQRATSSEKERAADSIRTELSGEIGKGEVVVKEFSDKVIIMLPEQVLFDSGSATISRDGQVVLQRMAKILKKVKNNQIRVEGHTDSAPVGQKIAGKFPTNWDLAAARATNVVKHLQKKGKLDPKLLALAGYGSNVPAADNKTPKGRKLNRRIEIALVPLGK